MKHPYFLICICLASILSGGGGGKISGTVTAQDGTPLVGANVIIIDTDLGTATDANGEYFILNIGPDAYDIEFRMIGFKTHVYRNVLLKSELTTVLDAELEQSFLEIPEVVEVNAERALIQRDATSKISIITSEQLANMPVTDFKDVMTASAGFTTDEEGGIHVRGGRTEEIQYMIDGVIVEDPMKGDFTGTISPNAIQEMTIISGTFNAEYGQAMSAIVNLVTKDGSEDFSLQAEYFSDQVNDMPYHQRFAFDAVQDSSFEYVKLRDALFDYLDDSPELYPESLVPLFDLPFYGRLSLNSGGSIPGTPLTYFASWYYDAFEDPLPHGFSVRQDNQLKLSWPINPRLKLTTHVQSAAHLYQNYSHAWKYLPENHTHTYTTNDRYVLRLNHSLNEALFYHLSLSQNTVGTRMGVQDKTPDQYEKSTTGSTAYFIVSGDQDTYLDNQTQSTSLKYDVTWQNTQRHQLKSGFQLTRHHLDLYQVQEPWEDGVNFVDDTTFTPLEGAFYIQNKIEFPFIVLNLGLRFDYIDPAASMWRNIRQFVVFDSLSGQYVQAPMFDVSPSYQWSPRIGLSYPVSDETIFHFSYGHFFQNPDFEAITYNARKDLSASLPLVGNPAIKPQKTISFETGLKQAIGQNIALEVTAWMKDIRDLLSTVQIRYLSNQYIVYDNTDYASVKGFDITLRRRYGQIFNGSFNYTFSIAKGNNSTPMGGFFSAYTQEEIPHQEFFLSFDQRHDFAMDLNLTTPVHFGPSFAGFRPLEGINANLLISAGSGLPYTPYVDPTIRVDINSARKPWTFSADLRVRKRVVMRRMSLLLFLEVLNLTDYENVQYVFSRTGKPFDSGQEGTVGSSLDANHNPDSVGPGRSIKMGAAIEI